MPSITIREDHLRMVQAILAEHIPHAKVSVFGSRATGKAKLHSDLDLLIDNAQPLSLDLLGALRDAFSESDIPYFVDIIDEQTLSEEFRAVVSGQKLGFI
jgi:predicted nucleotidyltransferase